MRSSPVASSVSRIMLVVELKLVVSINRILYADKSALMLKLAGHDVPRRFSMARAVICGAITD